MEQTLFSSLQQQAVTLEVRLSEVRATNVDRLAGVKEKKRKGAHVRTCTGHDILKRRKRAMKMRLTWALV